MGRGVPQRPDRRWRRRRKPCLDRPAWPGLRCPPSGPVAIGCTLHPTRQRNKAAACPASPGPEKARVRSCKATKMTDSPSSPHPRIFAPSHVRPAIDSIADHPQARGESGRISPCSRRLLRAHCAVLRQRSFVHTTHGLNVVFYIPLTSSTEREPWLHFS